MFRPIMFRAQPSVDETSGAPAAAGLSLGTAAGLIGADWQSLSLFRILFALYLAVDFFVNSFGSFADFYGEHGILPFATLVAELDDAGAGVLVPVLRAIEPLASRGVFSSLYVGALVAFGLGYRTRLANLVVFVLNGFLYWRGLETDSGAEVLAHLLLLWCLFLPMSRYWSLDGALDPAPRDRAYPALPLLAIRIQIASLYLFAALFKLAGTAWRDGSALGKVLSDNVYGGTAAGLILAERVPALLHGATYLVIAFQLAFPFLVYCPWRNAPVRAAALAGAALMHLSFIVFLNVGGFPYLCCAMLVLLVPDAWFDRLLASRRARLARIAIYYEPDCGFCLRVALILREFLLLRTSPVLAASADPIAQRLLAEHRSWVVMDPDGTPHLKWRAVAYLLERHVLFAPLGWITDIAPLRAPMARFYDWIGANRRRLGSLTRHVLPFKIQRPIGRPALVLCGTLVALALLGNIASLVRLSTDRLKPLDRAIAVLQVAQNWGLFAPTPTNWRRELRITMRTGDGSASDLVARLVPPLFHGNARGGIDFLNDRWLKYFTGLDHASEREWAALGDYLCRRARAVAGGAGVQDVALAEFRQPADTAPASRSVPVHQRTFRCA